MLRNAIKYIYEVYNEKSFLRAAEKLYISQPALSTAIQKEELYWGCTFFDRSKNPIEPTEEGSILIDAIERMMAIQAEVAEKMASLSNSKKTLNIGAPAFFCSYFLPQIIKGFHGEYPHCNINIIEAGDKDLFESMKSGLLDCCISVESGLSNMTVKTLSQESLVLAVPKSLKINNQLLSYQLNADSLTNAWLLKKEIPKVPIREFSDYPFLLLNRGNDMRNRAQKIFREGKITPNTIITLEQMMTAYYMAASGIGITFVRAGLMYQANLANKGLCFYAIDSKYAQRNINLIVKKNVNGVSELSAFIEYVQNRFNKLQ